MIILRALCCSLLLFAHFVDAAEPQLEAKDLPRIAPTEATNALKTFKIKPGFKLELVAAEPLVVDPIALAFDEDGRMFVVEMRDYSEMREVKPHLGRIRMLEDTNNDGKFDKASIYAENLPWPTAVICYDGGIFVGATPDLWFFKDTNGDGKADIRKKVFTGFGTGKDRLNVQALFNSFNWGLDNKIHGQTAGNGGLVARSDKTNATPIDVRGRDFWFDPKTLEFGTEAGGGQYGMSYDNHGRKFVCSNSDHIQTFMYDARYAERNPYYNMPPPRVSIAVDGPAAEVYRISLEEAWRVIRTKWRVTGAVPGIIEGGGRSAGYFTGATGLTIYRGDALGEEFVGDGFVGDAGGNLVHRKKIRYDKGLQPYAERPADEQKVEFLASTDNWFRPVDMFNAPDGALYICDMYREVIEHPWSLPDSMKKFLDLNSGNDRGRIYRVVPENFKQPKPVRLSKASTKKLVAALESPNGWTRDTAARLIWQRQDKAAIPLLKKMAVDHPAKKNPMARLHALHALDGLNALTEPALHLALYDTDPIVREHAVQLSEKLFSAGASPSKLWMRLKEMFKDPALAVRYQLALTMGELKTSERIYVLAEIARRDFEDSWMQAAILSSLENGAGEMFAKLSGDAKLAGSKKGQEFLRQLVQIVGAKNQQEEVAQVLDFISKEDKPAPLTFAMIRALGEGLQRNNNSLPDTESVKSIFSSATKLAADDSASEGARVQAVQLLGLARDGSASQRSIETLLGLLDLKQPQAVQLAAISSLAKFSDPQVGKALIESWNTLTPRVRTEAVSVLLARPERATALLQAIESGAIRVSVLNSTQTKLLRNHADKDVRQLAVKVLATKPASTRQQVIDSFMSALNLKGDVERGKKVYAQLCMSCHKSGGEGFALGPDLSTVKTAGRENNLVNILDPNREVRPEFNSYVIETKDDNTLLGIVVNETTASVTLREAFGKETVVPRSNIASMRSQGNSIMPEGLEAGLKPQDMADLLEFIETAENK